MSGAWWFVGGLVVGAVLLAPNEASCCRRVSAAVRGKAQGALGDWIGPLGDSVGLWSLAPGLLDTFGVPDDA